MGKRQQQRQQREAAAAAAAAAAAVHTSGSIRGGAARAAAADRVDVPRMPPVEELRQHWTCTSLVTATSELGELAAQRVQLQLP
jgi:hypothetical protein